MTEFGRVQRGHKFNVRTRIEVLIGFTKCREECTRNTILPAVF